MSLNPGVQQYCETTTGIHVTKPDGTVKAQQPVKSCTQDAATSVEYGRVADASKYTATASNGEPLPDYTPAAPDTTSGGSGTDTVY